MCSGNLRYPVWIEEGGVSVRVASEDDLAQGLSDWTSRYYAKVQKRPGVTVHPRALMRIVREPGSKWFLTLCPYSWPAETWVRLVIEQIAMDTSGMQVRYLYNDLPWLEQPAIYCDAFGLVSEAKSVAKKWSDDRKEAERARESTSAGR